MMSSYSMSHFVSFSSPDASQIDSFDDHNQLLVGKSQRLGTADGLIQRGHLKAARFKPLIKQPEAVAVPQKNLHLVPATVYKHKRPIVQRIFAKIIGYQPHQAVKVLAHVGGLAVKMYPIDKR